MSTQQFQGPVEFLDNIEVKGGIMQGQRCKVEAVTANKTLDAEDSGKIFLVNPAATTAITLPTLSASLSGWWCTVILTEDAAVTDQGMGNIVNIDLGSGTNLANVGHIVEVDGGAGNFAAANDDFIACTANATAGDRFDLFTDGNRWYAYGVVKDLSTSDFAAAAAS
jgi:hypothetical protein